MNNTKTFDCLNSPHKLAQHRALASHRTLRDVIGAYVILKYRTTRGSVYFGNQVTPHIDQLQPLMVKTNSSDQGAADTPLQVKYTHPDDIGPPLQDNVCCHTKRFTDFIELRGCLFDLEHS